MTRRSARKAHILSVVALVVTIVMILAAPTSLSQVRKAGQASGESSVVSAPPGAITPAQALEHPLLPGAGNAQRVPVNPGQRKKSRVVPMDSNPPLFLPAVTYDSGGGPAASAAVADVNGDGKPDLVVANECADISCANGSVAVLLGNGDGTFQPAVSYYSGGSYPTSVAAADVNGDNKPDLVVGNLNWGSGYVGSVAVLLGNGNGTFQPAVTFDCGGESPTDLAVVDVNRDGKPDLVVTGEGGSVAVLLGNGDGTFQSAVTYGSGGVPLSAAVADVNGDGNPDLVVANFYSKTVGVLLGNGDGTFQPAVTYNPGGQYPSKIAITDVNGDNKPDLAVANCGGANGCNYDLYGSVAVLLGNGDGTFQSAVPYDSGGTMAFGVAIADVNGDGKPDLLVANSCGNGDCGSDGSVGVLLGNGDGTFQPAVTYGSGGYHANWIVAADVNGDGRPDLVVENGYDPSNENDGAVGVLLNNTGPHSPTTITLVSSLNPAPPHKVVTYTATVTSQDGGAVTGSVVFQDGDSPIAQVPLANNQAAFSTTYKQVGTHAITATYPGSVNNTGSTSPTLTEYIEYPSRTSLTTSGSPSFVGQPVTFTATVTSTHGAIPDGELVTFYDGSAEIGTGTTTGGVATFTTSSLTAKKHTIKTIYQGDGTFRGSIGVVKQVVDGYTTTTTLVSSLNPSTYGQAVTFTATVASTGPNTPTGSVKFGGLGYAPLSGGVATLTKTWLNAGTYAITAEYQGDSASAPSTSAVLDQVVNPASTTTAITSSANPSSPGETVTFTATVTSSTGAHATGTVTFTAGTTTLGTVALNGIIASISTATLPVGSTIITATYNGATDFTGSSASLTQKNEARKSKPQTGECWTTTALSSSGSPSLVTDGVTFTADVNLSTYCRGEQTGCDGQVVFYDRRTVIGTAPVNSKCVATIGVSLTIGSHRIEAALQPPSHWYPSYAYITQVVNGFPTFTTLGSSQNPSIYGQDVTIAATVGSDLGGPAPTGKMKFVDGANTLGYVTLDNNGVATFTKKFLPVGTNPITAEYFGDSLYAPSKSPVLNQVVNPVSTTTAITSSANPSSSGQSVTFRATVRSSTGVLPTGTVTFTAGATTLGTVALDGKHASISTAALPVGSTIVTATYNGATDFTGSSAALTQTVQP